MAPLHPPSLPRLQLMPITRIARFTRAVTHSALFSLDVVDGDLSCVLGGIQRNRTNQFAWINCSRFVIRWGRQWARAACHIVAHWRHPPGDINLYLQKCKQKLLIHAHLKERRQAKAVEKAERNGAERGVAEAWKRLKCEKSTTSAGEQWECEWQCEWGIGAAGLQMCVLACVCVCEGGGSTKNPVTQPPMRTLMALQCVWRRCAASRETVRSSLFSESQSPVGLKSQRLPRCGN